MRKICEGVDRNFFCYPEGRDHICYVLVLTKSYKRACATHLQHDIEYNSDLL